MTRFRHLIDALEAAPASRPFIIFWIDEDERETVTFSEFRQRACVQAEIMRDHGLAVGSRVVIIMPQGICAMTAFVGALMLGAVPTFLPYPNFKIDPFKYRSGLAGVTANIRAQAVIIDDAFPDDMLHHVSLDDETMLLRSSDGRSAFEKKELSYPKIQASDLAFIQHSAGTTGLQKGVALTHALRTQPTRAS